MESSIDNVCQNIFENLIPAMQFPEIATAIIELDGWRFTSGKYSQDLIPQLQSKTKSSTRLAINGVQKEIPHALVGLQLVSMVRSVVNYVYFIPPTNHF